MQVVKEITLFHCFYVPPPTISYIYGKWNRTAIAKSTSGVSCFMEQNMVEQKETGIGLTKEASWEYLKMLLYGVW